MSNELEREIESIMEKIAKEHLALALKNTTEADVENLSLVFTYKNTLNLVRLSGNLVKQSSRLSWLTIGLLITSLGMIALAIAQLVKFSQ